MSHEYRISPELRDYWLEQPLLQAGQLEKAGKINHPETIGGEQLNLWYGFAKEFCEHSQIYQAVAFTQFNPDVRVGLGFSRHLPPRVIYYTNPQIDLEGSLIINPKVTMVNKAGYVPVFEACGSIGYGTVSYFINRPVSAEVQAYRWHPSLNQVELWNFRADNPHTDFVYHEYCHLNGETALDEPYRIYNICDTDNWQCLLEVYENYSETELIDIITHYSPGGVLVFDPYVGFRLYDLKNKNTSIPPFNIQPQPHLLPKNRKLL